VICLPIAWIMSFTVTTQLPPDVFNYHDDFEKYFAHPVRMLQTGTLFGSPLNALGSETLGGQAVLQAIVLNHFPLQYINGIDAVFGLFLCLLLSASLFPLRASFIPMCLIILLMVFFVNPLYVNVSSLYIATAFIMSAILLLSGINGSENNEKIEKLPSSVLVGIIYAALIAAKSILVIFALVHPIIFLLMMKRLGVNLRSLIRWGLVTAGVTLLFLLPWILLYLPYYIHASFVPVASRADMVIPAIEKFPNILSTSLFIYGERIVNYTLMCVALSTSVVAIALWKRKYHSIALDDLVASGTTIVFVYILLLSLGPAISGYGASFRYAVPVIIGGTTIILSLFYLKILINNVFEINKSFAAIPLLFGILIIISFSPTLMARIHQGYNNGSILAFSKLATNIGDIRYSQEVMYGDTRLRVMRAQKSVPSGKAILAWINTPFYLDYNRNIIYDAERSGIATPWAYVPDVEYYFLEYKGSAVRSLKQYLHPDVGEREQYISEKCIMLLEYFQQLRNNSEELYNDGRIVVLKKAL